MDVKDVPINLHFICIFRNPSSSDFSGLSESLSVLVNLWPECLSGLSVIIKSSESFPIPGLHNHLFAFSFVLRRLKDALIIMKLCRQRPTIKKIKRYQAKNGG